MLKRAFLKSVSIFLISFFSFAVIASTETWDFDDGTLNGNGNGNYMAVEGSHNNSLTITGWSDTGGNSDNKIRNGRLRYSDYYGLMFTNRDENIGDVPDHSIDSFGNDFDMVLLSFVQAVDLSRFDIGWATERKTAHSSNKKNRADISVVAYTGSGGFSFTSHDTWSGIADSSSWTTVGRYGDVKEWGYQSVDSDVKSKYWLIGAYNPLFDKAKDTTSRASSGWRDGFKLASVQGTSYRAKAPVTSVPEPSSVAILALGLVGLMVSQRRKQC